MKPNFEQILKDMEGTPFMNPEDMRSKVLDEFARLNRVQRLLGETDAELIARLEYRHRERLANEAMKKALEEE